MPTTIYLSGGGVISGLRGYSDEIVASIDRAKAEGEPWAWLEVLPKSDAIYSTPDPDPIAVAVAEVAAVSGLRASS